MADLTITAANVKKGASAKTEEGLGAVALTAGLAVYKEAATSKFRPTDADSATPEARAVYGVTLNACAADQPVVVHKKGRLAIGATVAVATPYFASATAGGICPVGDLASGMYPTLIGFAVSTTEIDVNIVAAGVAKP